MLENVNVTMRPFLAPFAPSPLSDEELQAARAEAWREVQQFEANDSRYHRALQDQQQQAHLRRELA